MMMIMIMTMMMQNKRKTPRLPQKTLQLRQLKKFIRQSLSAAAAYNSSIAVTCIQLQSRSSHFKSISMRVKIRTC